MKWHGGTAIVFCSSPSAGKRQPSDSRTRKLNAIECTEASSSCLERLWISGIQGSQPSRRLWGTRLVLNSSASSSAIKLKRFRYPPLYRGSNTPRRWVFPDFWLFEHSSRFTGDDAATRKSPTVAIYFARRNDASPTTVPSFGAKDSAGRDNFAEKRRAFLQNAEHAPRLDYIRRILTAGGGGPIA